MTIKIPKISTIVAVCSLLAFAGTGYGWIKTSTRNAVEREIYQAKITALETENKNQQNEINELKTNISVVGANLVLLLEHFHITPAKASDAR